MANDVLTEKAQDDGYCASLSVENDDISPGDRDTKFSDEGEEKDDY